MFGVVKRFKVYNFLIDFNEGVTRLHVRFGSTRTMRFNLSLIDQFYFNYIYWYRCIYIYSKRVHFLLCLAKLCKSFTNYRKGYSILFVLLSTFDLIYYIWILLGLNGIWYTSFKSYKRNPNYANKQKNPLPQTPNPPKTNKYKATIMSLFRKHKTIINRKENEYVKFQFWHLFVPSYADMSL